MRLSRIVILLVVGIGNPGFVANHARADVELPMGALGSCPFTHDDSYDLAPLLDTLKAQLEAQMANQNACQSVLRSLVANLSPLQDFYKTLDPATRQKITKSVYAGALSTLTSRKLQLEMSGDTSSPEYQNLSMQITAIDASNMANEIDLQSLLTGHQQTTEAYYRGQLLAYTSNVLNAFNSTARSNPACIGAMGGWSSALSAVLGGFSVATGLGVNPTAQVIGAAVGAGAQLITLLQDSRVRASYRGLVRLKNYKTLACTYYAVKKASCEYRRAYLISQDSGRLRQFLRNRFGTDTTGEYERYFVNRGRIKQMGDVFAVVARMGSPLTLDQAILTSYLAAKAVDFEKLGPPPAAAEQDDVIKGWLVRARAFGVIFAEITYQTGSAVSIALRDQLKTATDDIDAKKSIIVTAERLILANLSFLDLRRRLSSEFPNIGRNVLEMRDYLVSMQGSALVPAADKATIDASVKLLTKLLDFLNIATGSDGTVDAAYEDEVVAKGGAVFEELSKGSVAQLTRQSVLALAGKGIDRMGWSFGVIQNAYLHRDLTQNLPTLARFGEYRKSRDVLSDVVGNYGIFAGAGVTFRNEEFTRSVSAFEDSFKKEMLESLEFSLTNQEGIPELHGQTAAHLCAMYSPSLEAMSRRGLLGSNRAARILASCRERHRTLPSNNLVSSRAFPIDYADECVYFTYSREMEINQLLAQLIAP